MANVPPVLTHGRMVLKRCRHGLMLFNQNDTFVGRSLDVYGEWAEFELRLLGVFVVPGDIVVDVGANIGTHTVFLANAVGPTGRVLAFEPQRLVYQNLCANVALNSLANVDCRREAVGAQDATGSVAAPDPDTPQNFGAPVVNKAQVETVRVVALDSLGLPRCKLIKIDVEGMEAAVLEGAAQTIARCQPLLFVENNTTEGSREILEALDGLGYHAFWHIAPYFHADNHFGHPEDVFPGIRPEANLLATPKSLHIEGLTPATGPDDDWKQAWYRIRDAAS